MQLVEENAFVECYFQSVYVNPIRFVRFLESIHSFFYPRSAKRELFGIPISCASIESCLGPEASHRRTTLRSEAAEKHHCKTPT
jgi:hypothetical protein